MNKNRINESLIIENQYFGNIDAYYNYTNYTNIIIEQFESYQKTSFRNRCIIAGPNGLVHLSVPIENGRNQKCLIKEVKIANRDRWQQQHWRTLVSCYGNAPFFEFYRDWIELFYKKEFVWLFDMNLESLFWLKKVLAIKAEISLSENYSKEYTDTVSDSRNCHLPNNFQQKELPFRYVQVFEDKIGFQANLSILDLLFCEGPRAKQLLASSN